MQRSRRNEVLRGSARLLFPLLDRNKVARNFGRLASTVSEFTYPREQWPEQARVLQDAREFLESCVRFTVRRRTLIALFSLIAASIPFIQVWLVVKQNEIIENQAKFAEIQVYDIVARSMTEGDRNARLMSGALLSRADLEFLAGVVEEAFDSDLSVVYAEAGVNAAARRLEDAAFRGPLVRAVVGAVQASARRDPAERVWQVASPMLEQIVRDGEARVPVILRLSSRREATGDELDEQVDAYIVQVGIAMRTYLQLARAAGHEREAWELIRRFLARASAQDPPAEAQQLAYRTALEQFFFAVELERDLESTTDWSTAKTDQSEALRQGIEKAREVLGEDGVSWDGLKLQLGVGK